MSGDPDESLIAQYRKASPDEQRTIANELFARHYERVARWCYRFTGERESAADLAQEVFIKAHRHLDSFRAASRFSSWLYTIVRNEFLNRVQRAGPRPVDFEDTLLDMASAEPNPEQRATESSRARRLYELLQETLEDAERTVFTLHYGDGMPLEAITRMLRLENPSGAKAYIVSAKRKLARAAERMRARGERL